VHSLTSVPLSVRPWYRVEMPFDAQDPGAPAGPFEAAPVVPAPAEAPIAELAAMPAPEPAAAVAPVEEFVPAEPVAPVEALEPMTPELAEAVAGGRRSMGFFTR
jgi:hypothetical protein